MKAGRLLRTLTQVLVVLTPKWLMAQVNPALTDEQLKGQEFSHSIAFSPDGRYALVGHENRRMKFWELSTGREAGIFTGHSGAVVAVAFSPDGEHILSGSEDSTVKLWAASSRNEVRSFTGHTGTVLSVAFSSDGTHVLSGSEDHTMKLWETASGELIRTFQGHDGYSGSVVLFSPDGQHVLMGNTLWETSTGEEIQTFGPTGQYGYWKDSARFTEDGARVWIGETLYDIATGNAICLLEGIHGATLHKIFAHSPDGNSVFGGGGGDFGTVDHWYTKGIYEFDSTQGPARLRAVSSFNSPASPVTAIAFSRDSRFVLVRTLGQRDLDMDNLTLFDVSDTNTPVSSFRAR